MKTIDIMKTMGKNGQSIASKMNIFSIEELTRLHANRITPAMYLAQIGDISALFALFKRVSQERGQKALYEEFTKSDDKKENVPSKLVGAGLFGILMAMLERSKEQGGKLNKFLSKDEVFLKKLKESKPKDKKEHATKLAIFNSVKQPTVEDPIDKRKKKEEEEQKMRGLKTFNKMIEEYDRVVKSGGSTFKLIVESNNYDKTFGPTFDKEIARKDSFDRWVR